MNIELKLKTYDELQFEIINLNTRLFLKNKEIDRLNNITSKLEKWLKENAEKDTYSSIIFGVVLNYFQELKDSD